MIFTTDIKCFLILLHLAEVIHSTIIVVELRIKKDADNEEHAVKDNVLITSKAAWVKRIVPSNYKSPKYEYDSKFRTIFAPKYRIHKRKEMPEEKHEDDEPVSLDKVLLQPFKRKTQNRELLENIDRMLEELKYEGVQKLYDRKLRHGSHDEDMPPHEHKPFNFPHYSIWNYWTYEQNLLHDECPGQQVKVGSKCIWAPPHRK
ncbi:hypothetical protein MSG28_014003 [Choristoneura fumiferana]|uniref:Uncharacterized protein n=1 Tax=Choristoneura fumiferana TaxID=7141 RepID=A0ACC0KAF1_CHOFU|nr:hypothetical protein MSG28_014003 [Choristoneura fumiferana]